MSDTAVDFDGLAARVAECPRGWRRVFEPRLRGLKRRARRGQPTDRGVKRLARDTSGVLARHQARGQRPLKPSLTASLPVLDHREALMQAVSEHQVVVVCGETGSGKSTQLPQLCLAMGRGIDGVIAHTQPRRIAARNLAGRVAEELDTGVGEGVGYKIRFQDRVSADTRIKLVTDGMLLAETQGDPDLAEYDTIIIDEAHERSLNIDFLVGYLRRLTERRPELKVIITSATIDPARFAAHFGDAPVVEVSGRSYPVETRYRPLAADQADERERTLAQGILDAVDELAAAGPGDILVFLPGERDIREAAEALRKHHPRGTEILPLYGRLSAAEQQRVFAPHQQRRVVLATNVAETSLTVPGIRSVIDAGLVRLSRYSARTKVQRLPVEPISQASAEQRAGRCGRLGPGICIRLYAEADLLAQPQQTEPEIRRTNLAAVILQMKYLRLGEATSFPFLDPPEPRYVRDGEKLLRELQALDGNGELTAIGKRLARLPVDPRIGRMLLAGADANSLAELLVLAAAMTIQDPRERPMEARGQADEAHAEWQDSRSDFLALLNLWVAYQQQRRRLSANKLRQWCRERFVSYSRMREWAEVHRQLRELMKGMGYTEATRPGDYEPVHRAMLTGLLANVALRSGEQQYTGPRGLKLQIHPGSGLAKARPSWIVAAELVETSRTFARLTAAVRPEWIESAASHLVSRQHYAPYWDARRRRVRGYEDVALYGLTLVSQRRVDYALVAPSEARRVFISEGLMRGRLKTRAECLRANRALVATLEAEEAKTRRRDLLDDEAVLEGFFDERIPAHVLDGASFDRWVQRGDNDARLRLTREVLTGEAEQARDPDAFPEVFTVAGISIPLRYCFQPGDSADGITALIPLAALNQLPAVAFEWLVPGLIQEKVTTLIRTLPKALRKNFVPAPDFAAAVLQATTTGQDSLVETLRAELERMTGVKVPLDAWDGVALPRHLIMRYQILDDEGDDLATGRDFPALQEELGGRARQAFGAGVNERYRCEDLREWGIGELPTVVDIEHNGVALCGYPALVDDGGQVDLRLLDAREAAECAHRAGVRRLIMRVLGEQTRHLRRNLPRIQQLCLLFSGVGRCEALREDLLAAAIDRVFLAAGTPRSETGFRNALAAGRGELAAEAEALSATVEQILEHHRAARRRLAATTGPALHAPVEDMRQQLDALVYPGFVLNTPSARLTELPRYLQGVTERLDRLARNPGRDERARAYLAPWCERHAARRALHTEKAIDDPALEAFGWLLEEYRISLFAQGLGTLEKVSEKRLSEAWAQVR